MSSFQVCEEVSRTARCTKSSPSLYIETSKLRGDVTLRLTNPSNRKPSTSRSRFPLLWQRVAVYFRGLEAYIYTLKKKSRSTCQSAQGRCYCAARAKDAIVSEVQMANLGSNRTAQGVIDGLLPLCTFNREILVCKTSIFRERSVNSIDMLTQRVTSTVSE